VIRTAPSPWRLGGLGVGELARRVWAEVGDDEVMDRAAALSYYFVFALFPTLLFLAALLGLLPSARLLDRLMEYLVQVLPPDAASIITRTLQEILRGARGSVLSIGAVAALWAASSGMASIITALNVAYDVTDERPWWKRRLIAVGLTVMFASFTLTALVVLVLGPPIVEAVARSIGLGSAFTRTWTLLQWPGALVLVMTGVGLVYYLAPNVRQRWYWVTPGSAFAVTGWLLASAGLRFYVSRFADYNATYGSITGVILLMLWLFVTGLVLLVGAEINAEIAHAAARRAPQAPAVPRPAAA
jgi:membrane protein